MNINTKKEFKKEYIKGVFFESSMKALVKVSVNGTVISLKHGTLDILTMQYMLDSANQRNQAYVKVEGVNVPTSVVPSLISLLKNINADLHNHLFEKQTLIEGCSSEIDVEAVQWGFNINQTYTI